MSRTGGGVVTEEDVFGPWAGGSLKGSEARLSPVSKPDNGADGTVIRMSRSFEEITGELLPALVSGYPWIPAILPSERITPYSVGPVAN